MSRTGKRSRDQSSDSAGASSQQLPRPLALLDRYIVKSRRRSTHEGPQTPVRQVVFERDVRDRQWQGGGPSHICSEEPLLVAPGPSTVPHCSRDPQKQAFPLLTSESNPDNQGRHLPLATNPDNSKTLSCLTDAKSSLKLPKTYLIQTLFSGLLKLILPEFLVLVIKTTH